jgi:hypothetical protein
LEVLAISKTFDTWIIIMLVRLVGGRYELFKN